MAIADYLLHHPENLNPQTMGALARPGRIDVVITSEDKGLLHRWWLSDRGWHPHWEARGGQWASRCSMVADGDVLYVFALGSEGDLWCAPCAGGCTGPGEWNRFNLGRPENDRLISHPAALLDGEQIIVLVRGELTTLWALILTGLEAGFTWAPVNQLGLPPPPRPQSIRFAPAAVFRRPGQLNAFLVDNEGQLRYAWHDRNTGRSASRWEVPHQSALLGHETAPNVTGITSSPDAVAWPPDAFHVVACGPPDTPAGPVFQISSFLGRHWGGLRFFAPGAASDGAVASAGPGRLDVFYVGVKPGGSFGGGPFVSKHMWREQRNEWHEDTSFILDYPVGIPTRPQ